MIAHKLYRWSIDRINGRFISGWCFNRLHKKRPVRIVAAADETILGEFTNDGYRPDLVEQKMHPDGVCAFDFSFPDNFNPASFETFYLYFDSFKKPAAAIDCSDIDLLRPHRGKPVCFMHIPKTAGTSFNSFARLCYPGSRFKTHIERFDSEQRARAVETADYCAGHLTLDALLQLHNLSRFELYSVIREPYAHLHSHLNYIKQVRPGSSVETLYTYRHNETIKGLSDKLNGIDFSDAAAIASFAAGLAGYELDFFDNIQTRYFLDYRPDRVGKQDLDQAKRNLERFRSVGLTENYDAFRDRFCEDRGLPHQTQDLQSNKAAYYRLFDLSDQAIRKALRPLVVFDLDLYDHVSTRFQ